MTLEQSERLEKFIKYGFEVHVDRYTNDGIISGKIYSIFTMEYDEDLKNNPGFNIGDKFCSLNLYDLNERKFEVISILLKDLKVQEIRVSKRIDWLTNVPEPLEIDFHEKISDTYAPIILDLWMREEGIVYKNFLNDLSQKPSTIEYKLALELFTYIMKSSHGCRSRDIAKLSFKCEMYILKIGFIVTDPKSMVIEFKKFLDVESCGVYNTWESILMPQIEYFIECLLNVKMERRLGRDKNNYICRSKNDLISLREIAESYKRRTFRA